jgi:hypothetical protein
MRLANRFSGIKEAELSNTSAGDGDIHQVHFLLADFEFWGDSNHENASPQHRSKYSIRAMKYHGGCWTLIGWRVF